MGSMSLLLKIENLEKLFMIQKMEESVKPRYQANQWNVKDDINIIIGFSKATFLLKQKKLDAMQQ